MLRYNHAPYWTVCTTNSEFSSIKSSCSQLLHSYVETSAPRDQAASVMIFIWFLRWLNSSDFLTGTIVTWSPREINPIVLLILPAADVSDWFQFHFNPEPISAGFALDLISSQYNTIVYFPRFTLTRGARWLGRSRRFVHQLITSVGNLNCSMTRCDNFLKLLSL